ncbi:hypothetical protein [Streptomyces sp. INR7]|uniref:hypothetical protein n=1 Tax=Streptomyces sp. INR7 TaxID=2607753 RepID=UPI0016231FCE|nr:hypothetical protein [Streptomyces sp. INR7]QNE29106.1 hypothetical protein F1D59_33675 [Streptomyces sp. INR7]
MLTALDAADVPDALEPKASLGTEVEQLIRLPEGRLPVHPDPRPEYEAVREILDLAQELTTITASGDDQRAVVETLRRVRQAWQESGTAE